MSAEGNTSNEELMDDQLLTHKRRTSNYENPNPQEASDPPCNKRRKRKDQKRDIGWRHGEMLNGMKQHWKCNYCSLVRHGGGVTRLKLHLVGGADVRKCPSVPDHVVEEILGSLKVREKEKAKEEEEKVKEKEKEKGCGKRGRKKGKKKKSEESDYDDDDYDDDDDQSDSLGTENYEVCEDEGRNSDTDSKAEEDDGVDYEAEEDVRDGEKWKSWKRVLENMLPGGIGKDDSEVQSCIQNALSHETSTNNLPNQEGSTRETTTTKCKEALVNTLISEKFATLCNLLRNTFIDENSEEGKRNYFDFSEIDDKLKNGDYERSPQMFIRDLRKLWDKFEKVGRELVRVSNSLSIVSRNNIETEVGIQINSDSHNSNRLEPDQNEPNQICNHCLFEITYNWGVINCKGCNITYHKSCINPLINPSTNHWFCSSCMSNNLDLNLISDTDGTDSDKRDSDSVQPCITAIYKLCKICGGKEEEDIEFLVCAHPECPYKYYHTKCLTKCLISNGTQVRETGYCWYCPSCLCRVCLCDRDDDKIVLCDGCDEAFHIYCMDPPRESVPEGKWFCRKCSAKRKREKGKSKKKNGVWMNDKKGINVCGSKNSEGKYYKPETHRPMDLLLNAVVECEGERS
ncbi:hypothetical protein LUZ60_001882 [Juncus effusus]|nr:hypothetical protein LUZ60_001882 [Juncus effusus]